MILDSSKPPRQPTAPNKTHASPTPSVRLANTLLQRGPSLLSQNASLAPPGSSKVLSPTAACVLGVRRAQYRSVLHTPCNTTATATPPWTNAPSTKLMGHAHVPAKTTTSLCRLGGLWFLTRQRFDRRLSRAVPGVRVLSCLQMAGPTGRKYHILLDLFTALTRYVPMAIRTG